MPSAGHETAMPIDSDRDAVSESEVVEIGSEVLIREDRDARG